MFVDEDNSLIHQNIKISEAVRDGFEFLETKQLKDRALTRGKNA